MIHEADELMYKSKKLGRNRVDSCLPEVVSNSGICDEGAMAHQ